jgi:hypothetical protein
MKRKKDTDAVAPCPSSQKQPDAVPAKSSAGVASLFAWALSQGACLDAVEHRMSPFGAGLFAKHDIEEGQLVASIPGKLVLEAVSQTNSPASAPSLTPGALQVVALIVATPPLL